jgi:predicted PurR-regulated permease PerM
LITVVVVIAVLYFARVVFVPFALAVLLSFLLAPLAQRLRHWGFGRVPSVVAVVLLALLVVGVFGGMMVVQMTEFGHQLPQYQKNIHDKVESLRASSSGVTGWLTRVSRAFSEEINQAPASAPPRTGTGGPEKPVPVEIRSSPFTPLQVVQAVLGSLFNVLFTALIVGVFVFFMLLQREDLRDRFIRLFGPDRLHVTTRALDEAAQRVSRYLLAQFALNVGFGLLAGVGLHFLGIPNPVLWGVLAALLRYVPYLGIWIAAVMPAAVAFAIGPDWVKPTVVLGLYFGIDLLMYNFAEPLLYGSSTGLTPLVILVAAVFWTWLWGPVGLLLSTPLTVCAAVIGRHAPSLQFLGVLLGDEPVLAPENRFYQRLLAMDVEEACDMAEEFLKETKSLEDLFDRMIIPALSLAEADRHNNALEANQEEFVLQNTRMIVEDIAERADALLAQANGDAKPSERTPSRQKLEPPQEVIVLSIPARDDADEISAIMLALLLNRRGVPAKSVSASALASEQVEEAARSTIRLACVSAVPPYGTPHVRYLCKRLRSQFPKLKIVAAVLNQGDARETGRRIGDVPADEIATSLKQAATEVLALIPGPREPVGQKVFSS